jgi:hypothetical protein
MIRCKALTRTALITFALAAWCAPALAQSANAIALAREIIALKGANAVFESLVPNTIQSAKATLLQTNPMLQRDLNDIAAQLAAEYRSRTNGYINDAAKAYASRFTEQELKDIVAFYKTPAGKKVITIEPEVFERSMTELQVAGNKFAEEVLNRFRAEMRKKGHEL